MCIIVLGGCYYLDLFKKAEKFEYYQKLIDIFAFFYPGRSRHKGYVWYDGTKGYKGTYIFIYLNNK